MIIYSKQYMSSLAQETGFNKDNLEKVLRLIDILKYLNSHQLFKDRVILKGGTAINLAVFSLPRLSVDIDLDFGENLKKEDLLTIRLQIKKQLTSYLQSEGYTIKTPPREHYALDSMLFHYSNNAGNQDNIKVEINYLNRVHIVKPKYKLIQCKFLEKELSVLMLDSTELFASKVTALLSRAVPRDLYDIYGMISNGLINDIDYFRKNVIFYNLIAGNNNAINLSLKIIDTITNHQVKRQLRPVLAKSDSFDLVVAQKIVKDYLAKALKTTPDESRFMQKFQQGICDLQLLFEDVSLQNSLKNHPALQWRLKALQNK